MKTIDWTKPIRFKMNGKSVRLVTETVFEGRKVYIIASHQPSKKVMCHMVIEDGTVIGATGPSQFDVENAPKQKRIPLTYNDCKNGIILRNSAGMTWVPHFINEVGVCMFANGKEDNITFVELSESDQLEYRTMDSSIWRPCYKTITIDGEEYDD